MAPWMLARIFTTRIELAQLGHRRVDFLQMIARVIEMLEACGSACARSSTTALRCLAHHVRNEKPGLLQVVEHAHALLDRDRSARRVRS